VDVKAEDNYNSVDARIQQWNCTSVDEQCWKIVDFSGTLLGAVASNPSD
jgi:hypothetical protein